MLKFNIPPPPPKEDDGMDEVVAMSSDSCDPYSWRRRITIPVSKEILDQCKVGDTATLSLIGRVVRTEADKRESEDAGKKEEYDLGIEISEVLYEGKNEYEELAED